MSAGALVLLAALLPLNLPATQIAAALLAVGVIVELPRRGTAGLRSALDAPLALLLFAAAVSLAAAPLPLDLGSALTLWPVFVFFFARLATRQLLEERPGALRIAFWVFLAVAALMSAYGLLQHFTGLDPLRFGAEPIRIPAPGHSGRFKAVGNFNRHTTLAFVLLFPLSLALALLFTRGQRGRRLPVLLVGVMLLALLATYSRASWLGLVAAAGVLAALHGRRGIASGLLLLSALALAALVLSPSVGAKAATTVDIDANQNRIFMWARTLEMIRDHPLFGIGLGNYQRIADVYYDAVDPSFDIRCHSHNLLLHFLAETGPVGLFAFVWLWVAWLRRVLPAAREVVQSGAHTPVFRAALCGGAAAVVAFLTGAFSQDPLFDGAVAFTLWSCMGVTLALAEAAQYRKVEPKKT